MVGKLLYLSYFQRDNNPSLLVPEYNYKYDVFLQEKDVWAAGLLIDRQDEWFGEVQFFPFFSIRTKGLLTMQVTTGFFFFFFYFCRRRQKKILTWTRQVVLFWAVVCFGKALSYKLSLFYNWWKLRMYLCSTSMTIFSALWGITKYKHKLHIHFTWSNSTLG